MWNSLLKSTVNDTQDILWIDNQETSDQDLFVYTSQHNKRVQYINLPILKEHDATLGQVHFWTSFQLFLNFTKNDPLAQTFNNLKISCFVVLTEMEIDSWKQDIASLNVLVNSKLFILEVNFNFHFFNILKA